jgi:hypothetical protein
VDPKVFGPDIGIPRIVGEAKLRQLRDVDMPYAWASGPGFFAEKKVGAERVVTGASEDNQPERPYFRTSGRVSVSPVPDGEPTEVQVLPGDSPTLVAGRPGPNADEEQTGPVKVRAASALNRSFQTGRRSFGAYKPEHRYTWLGSEIWALPVKFEVRWGSYFGNHRDVVTQELMHPLALDPTQNNGFAPATGVAFRAYGTDPTRRWWTALLFTQIVSVGFGGLGRTAPRYGFTVPVHALFAMSHGPSQYPSSTTYEAKTFTSYGELIAYADGAFNRPPFRHTMMQPSVLARPAAATREDVIGGTAPGILVAHTARMFDFQLGYHVRPAVSYFVENRGDGTPYLNTQVLDIFADAIAYEVDRLWLPYAMETGGDGRTYVFVAYSTPKSSAGLTVFNQPTVNADRDPGIVCYWTRNRGAAWHRRLCTEFRDMAFPSSYGLGTGGVTRPASSEPPTSSDLWDKSISETFEGSSFPTTAVTCPVADGILVAFTSLKPDPATFASGQLMFLKHPAMPTVADRTQFIWGEGITRTQVFKVVGDAITKVHDSDNAALAQPEARRFLDMVFLGHNTLLAKVGPTYRVGVGWHYYQGHGIYGATDADRNIVTDLGDGNSLNNWTLENPVGCTIVRSEDGGATWTTLGAEGFPGSGVMGEAITVRDSLGATRTVYPATPRPVQMSGRFTCVVPRQPKAGAPGEFEDATVTVPGYDPSEKAYFAYVSKDSGATWERQGRITTTNRFHHMEDVGPNDIGRNFAKIEYIGTRRNPSPYNPALPTMLDPEPET